MSRASHTVYDLYPQADGKVVVSTWTNDNLDLGEPSETARWEITYPDLPAALKASGGTRYGMWGHRVDVYLNGVLIDAQGNEIAPAERTGSPDGWMWGTDSDD